MEQSRSSVLDPLGKGLKVTLTAQPAAQAQQPNAVYISFSAEVNVQTTESLLAVCADLCQKQVKTVYLMLSTAGGMVMCGLNIYNVLRGMPFKLITHNVGNVDSIGNVIFLAGEERYSCPHATFMFHGVGFDMNGQMRFDQKILRERLGSIEADQKRIGQILTERSKLTADEVNRLFLEAQTRDPNYARANGIIHDIRDVQIPPGTPILQLIFKR